MKHYYTSILVLEGIIIKQHKIERNIIVITSKIMNEEQKRFIKLASEGHNIFLTGAGGTGKSYIIQHLVDKYKAINKPYGLTSMTGTAALLLGKATTLHSWACVGIARESAAKLIESINGSARSKRKWISEFAKMVSGNRARTKSFDAIVGIESRCEAIRHCQHSHWHCRRRSARRYYPYGREAAGVLF
jgi:Cdc6-like AAA superfamily ATPase